jgi:hypothetical protein
MKAASVGGLFHCLVRFATRLLDEDLPKGIQVFDAIGRQIIRERHNDIAFGQSKARLPDPSPFRLILIPDGKR